MSTFLQQRAQDLLRKATSEFLAVFGKIVAKQSAWEWCTSGSASLGGGTPAMKFSINVTGGNIFLSRGGTGKSPEDRWQTATDRVHIPYAGGGVGVGLAIPTGIQVSASYSSQAWWNRGWLYIVGGSEDFSSPGDFNEPGIGLGPYTLFVIEAALIPLRWAIVGSMASSGNIPGAINAAQKLPHSEIMDHQPGGSVGFMFIGINQSFYAHLKDFFDQCNKLRALAGHTPPTGFWAGCADALATSAKVEWDLAQMEYDILQCVWRMQNLFYSARAVLVSVGVEAAWPCVGISVYAGALKGCKNIGKAHPDTIPFTGVNVPEPSLIRPAGAYHE
jgi:hypothetical protein